MINKCQKDPTCGISLKRGMFMDNSESRMVVQGLVFQDFARKNQRIQDPVILLFSATERQIIVNQSKASAG